MLSDEATALNRSGGRHDYPDAFPAGDRTLPLSELQVGRVFGPLVYRLSPEAVERYRSALKAGPAGPGPDAAEIVPPILSCAVGLVKTTLAGRWPDSTVHISQRLAARAPLRIGDTVSLEVRVEALEGRTVVLALATRRLGEAPAVRAWMTIRWGREDA